MGLFVLALIMGLVILVISADQFVNGTATIAKKLGVPPLVIGLTIVGFGTSAPEILVSAISSFEGNPELAIGNALGSNIANIGLILGCTALIAPISVKSQILKRELPVLMTISVICYLLGFDGLGEIDGLIMLTGLVLFLVWLIYTARKDRTSGSLEHEIESELPLPMSGRKAWILFFLGLVGLLLSSKMLVWAAVNIALHFGVSDLVIGLSIVALGTSLPELAASIMSVLKKEDELALGNIIGSNVYNLLAVYSLPGLIAPGILGDSVLTRDFPVMLMLTAVIFILGYGFGGKPARINRLEGLGLVIAYCSYQWVVSQGALTV